MVCPDPESNVFSQPHFLNSPWLSHSNIDWSFLKSYGAPMYFKKNQVVSSDPETAECVYYIANGRVRSSVFSEEGEEKIILVLEQGNVINAVSVIDGLPSYLVFTTVVDSLLYKVRKEVFSDLVNSNCDISNKLLQDFTRKIRTLITQVEDLTFMNSSARIAKCLYRLSREYGEPCKNGIKLNIKFTHYEMAIYAGTCRVTASNVLQSLIEAGIIEKENGHIIIKDTDRLKLSIDHPLVKSQL